MFLCYFAQRQCDLKSHVCVCDGGGGGEEGRRKDYQCALFKAATKFIGQPVPTVERC